MHELNNDRVLIADEIAKGWIKIVENSIKSSDIITRFIFLWNAFSLFYSGTNAIILKENKENGRVDKRGNPESIPEITAIHLSMKEYEFRIYEWQTFPQFAFFQSKRIIIYMQESSTFKYNNRMFSTNADIFSPDSRTCMNGYLNLLYSIRCNLFQGRKHRYEKNDQMIIEKASECLMTILNEVFFN